MENLYHRRTNDGQTDGEEYHSPTRGYWSPILILSEVNATFTIRPYKEALGFIVWQKTGTASLTINTIKPIRLRQIETLQGYTSERLPLASSYALTRSYPIGNLLHAETLCADCRDCRPIKRFSGFQCIMFKSHTGSTKDSLVDSSALCLNHIMAAPKILWWIPVHYV